jgi:SHS2 domain-containing protein
VPDALWARDRGLIFGQAPRRWDPADREQAYKELEHPADMFLEIYGRDLPALFENALFAMYDEIAELEGFETAFKRTVRADGPTPADALRALLSEALYLFESERFIASQASVQVAGDPDGPLEVTAELNGEVADKERHTFFAEVKAVTYHQLNVERLPDGTWKATVLFDV